MTEKNDLANHFREQQQKYIYFLISACIASIAFVIVNTKNKPLQTIQIPLAIALLCWGASILSGLLSLELNLKGLSQNYIYLSVYDKFIDKRKELTEKFDEVFNENDEKLGIYLFWQKSLFILGMCSYLVWHIFEMYMRNLA